jgi:hypothetical protein
MHRLIVTIALLGAGAILATSEGPTLAAGAVTAPATAQVMAVVVATVISRGVPGRTNGRLRPPVSF